MVRRLACALLAVAACGDDEIIPPEQPPVADAAPVATFEAAAPPEMLRVEANATADGDGSERVECTMYLDVFDIAFTAGGWTAASGGEVIRRSFDGEDLLFEFSALLAGEVSLSDTGGAVEARLVGDQPDDAGAGDLELDAPGTWTMAPAAT